MERRGSGECQCIGGIPGNKSQYFYSHDPFAPTEISVRSCFLFPHWQARILLVLLWPSFFSDVTSGICVTEFPTGPNFPLAGQKFRSTHITFTFQAGRIF